MELTADGASRCPQCRRSVAPGRRHCLYCGATVLKSEDDLRIDVSSGCGAAHFERDRTAADEPGGSFAAEAAEPPKTPMASRGATRPADGPHGSVAPERRVLNATGSAGDAEPDPALRELVRLAGPELAARFWAQRTPRRRRLTPVMLWGLLVLAFAVTGMLIWVMAK